MRNILLALLAGVASYAALNLSGLLSLLHAVLPALLVTSVVYFLLARRVFKKVEKIFTDASKALQQNPPKFELAVSGMQKAYIYAPQQIGVRSQVDAQIGVIYFLQKDFKNASPYLERSLTFGHWLAGAMLAVVQYKRKDHDQMRDTLEVVTKRAKKQALAWCLRAYLLVQIGEKEAAQQVLVKGVKVSDDQKVKDALIAVQNNKKIKMRGFKEQWYQFHLERPPAEYQQVAVGGKASKAARRGRW